MVGNERTVAIDAEFACRGPAGLDVAFLIAGYLFAFCAADARALATFGPQRHPDLPDVKTAGEQGYPMDIGIHYVWYAPKGTPADRIKAVADAIESVVGDKQFQQRMCDRKLKLQRLRKHQSDLINK